jgi:hypothetical protein
MNEVAMGTVGMEMAAVVAAADIMDTITIPIRMPAGLLPRRDGRRRRPSLRRNIC